MQNPCTLIPSGHKTRDFLSYIITKKTAMTTSGINKCWMVLCFSITTETVVGGRWNKWKARWLSKLPKNSRYAYTHARTVSPTYKLLITTCKYEFNRNTENSKSHLPERRCDHRAKPKEMKKKNISKWKKKPLLFRAHQDILSVPPTTAGGATGWIGFHHPFFSCFAQEFLFARKKSCGPWGWPPPCTHSLSRFQLHSLFALTSDKFAIP